MVANRRKYTRVRARDVVAELSTAHGRSPVQVENISRGGAFVRAERILDVGSDVTVTLARAGARMPLSLYARVTTRVAADARGSRRVAGMGVQFMLLGEKESARLLALLRELGAPDEEVELTLSPEATEAELRALSLEEVPKDRKRARGGVKFELPRHLADDLAVVLREVEPPAARAKPKAPPPPPADAIEDDRPRRAFAEPQPPEVKRLLVQVRGLTMQLADAQQQIAQRSLEVESLREELESASEVAAAEIARLRKELALARAALDRSRREA